MLSIVPLMQRRRAVRDGRRRLGAQARAAVRQGEPPALGLARRVPRARGVARDARRQGRQPARAACSARRSTQATGKLLENGKSPSRKVGELDNRGSHFYLALYWAQALAEQTDDAELAEAFAPLAERLADDEETIVAELNGVQGDAGRPRRLLLRFTKENHLRWDSLGEFLALAAALEFLAGKAEEPLAVLGKALDRATGKLLENGKAPSRKVGELDNRGSHFYLTLYWAQALAEQTDDEKVQQAFAPLAERLADDEETIVAELNDVQGEPVELGGYYWVDREKATAAMRPSATFNDAIESL